MHKLLKSVVGLTFFTGLFSTIVSAAILTPNMDLNGHAIKAQTNSNVVKVQQQAPEAVQLRLINATGAPVDLYVVNQQTNQPEYFGELAPGETSDYQSWAGLIWIFGRNQQPFMNYQTNQPRFQEIFVAYANQQRPARFLDEYQPEPQQLGQAPLPQGQGQGQSAQPPSDQMEPPMHTGVAVPENLYPNDNSPQALPEPAGFWDSYLTPNICMRSRFAPGIEADTCRYLAYLAQNNPAKLDAFLNAVASRSGSTAPASANAGTATQANQNGILSVAAQSRGGVIRSGPSMDDQRLGYLQDGEQITLLQATGVWMNDHQWFQIRYGAGQTAYQWGGVLCSVNEQVAGAGQICSGN